MVNLVIGRECFVGLSIYYYFMSWLVVFSGATVSRLHPTTRGVEVVAVGEVRLLPHLRIRRLTTRQVLEHQMFYIKSFYRRNGLAMEHFSRRR